MTVPAQPSVIGVGSRSTIAHNFIGPSQPLIRIAHSFDPGLEVDGLYTTVFILTYNIEHATAVNDAIAALEQFFEEAKLYHTPNNQYYADKWLHCTFASERNKVALIYDAQVKIEAATPTTDGAFDMAPTANFAIAITRGPWESKTAVNQTWGTTSFTISSAEKEMTIEGTLPARIERMQWTPDITAPANQHATVCFRHVSNDPITPAVLCTATNFVPLSLADTSVDTGPPYRMVTTFATDATDVFRCYHVFQGPRADYQGDWDLRIIGVGSDQTSVFLVTPVLSWNIPTDKTASNLTAYTPLSTVTFSGWTEAAKSAGTVSLNGAHKYLATSGYLSHTSPKIMFKIKRVSGTGWFYLRGFVTLPMDHYARYDHAAIHEDTVCHIFTTPEGIVIPLNTDPTAGVPPNEMPEATVNNFAIPVIGNNASLYIWTTQADGAIIEPAENMAHNPYITYYPRWRTYAETT